MEALCLNLPKLPDEKLLWNLTYENVVLSVKTEKESWEIFEEVVICFWETEVIQILRIYWNSC